MNKILLGPQASGKGTVASKLTKHYGTTIIGTGNLLREEIKKETSLGETLKGILDRGELAPDELMITLIKNEIKKTKGGFILDGFPRNLKQAEDLDLALKELNQKIDAIFYLNLEKEQVIERISCRKICSSCSEVYNTKYVPPKKEGICNNCDTELIQRDDDKEEAIEKRLNIFEKNTKPLLSLYGNKVITIDASNSPERIFSDIQSHIDSLVDNEDIQ